MFFPAGCEWHLNMARFVRNFLADGFFNGFGVPLFHFWWIEEHQKQLMIMEKFKLQFVAQVVPCFCTRNLNGYRQIRLKHVQLVTNGEVIKWNPEMEALEMNYRAVCTPNANNVSNCTLDLISWFLLPLRCQVSFHIESVCRFLQGVPKMVLTNPFSEVLSLFLLFLIPFCLKLYAIQRGA